MRWWWVLLLLEMWTPNDGMRLSSVTTKPNAPRCLSEKPRCMLENESTNNARILSRKDLLTDIRTTLALCSTTSFLLRPQFAEAATSTAEGGSISACIRPPGGGVANCVSTASVKQVDLFMSPWTWPEGVSVDEVIGRLKGAIASDTSLSLVEQMNSNSNNNNRYYCKVRAVRNFCTDEIEFVVNAMDRVITFRSQQMDGPDGVSDFGANRKRLDEIRKRIAIVNVMGAEFDSADSGPREGTVDQLRAIWGYQSGSGYESILLDDDE